MPGTNNPGKGGAAPATKAAQNQTPAPNQKQAPAGAAPATPGAPAPATKPAQPATKLFSTGGAAPAQPAQPVPNSGSAISGALPSGNANNGQDDQEVRKAMQGINRLLNKLTPQIQNTGCIVNNIQGNDNKELQDLVDKIRSSSCKIVTNQNRVTHEENRVILFIEDKTKDGIRFFHNPGGLDGNRVITIPHIDSNGAKTGGYDILEYNSNGELTNSICFGDVKQSQLDQKWLASLFQQTNIFQNAQQAGQVNQPAANTPVQPVGQTTGQPPAANPGNSNFAARFVQSMKSFIGR